jgi:hypothetical protein
MGYRMHHTGSLPSERLETSPAHVAGRAWPILLGALGVVIFVLVGLAVYWSTQPGVFDVAEVTAATSGGSRHESVPGSSTVKVSIRIADTLLSKPGGFLYNDRLPPGVLLDNTPSWECGTLMALRDYVRALRNDFSRSRTQSAENADVKQADLRFAIDPESWLVPAAENEYRQGVDALRQYLADLEVGGEQTSAQFFARADNLSAYLAVVEKRLGNFGVRLSASVPDSDLAATIAMPAPSSDGTFSDEDAAPEQTAWDQVDNVYYCARGYSWALYHLMQAVAVDFDRVIEGKRAEVSVQHIIRDLKGATKPMGSPIVLNGDGYGILANHSLVLASYISKANAALMDLRILMQQG